MTDEMPKKLLREAQSADEARRAAAYERLREMYAPLLAATVRSFRQSLSSYGEDDLRQEADLVLFRAVGRYCDGKSVSFGSYLKVCLRNRFISLLRKEKRRPKLSQTDPDRFCGAACTSGGSRGYQKRSREETAFVRAVRLYGVGNDGRRLRERCEALLFGDGSPFTDTERQVYACYLRGLCYAETASLLHCDRKAVDNALRRAKTKLAALLPSLSSPS